MRLNTMITLGASAAFGLMAVVLARGWINGAVENEFRDTRPETTAQHAPAASTRPVLVANTNLQFGDVITEDDLARVDFPEAAIPFESFENVSDILGYDSAAAVNIIALTSIRKNEPILPHKISGPNGKGSLSARIRTGYRAASIRVDAVTGVSGFIVPGDIVDVIYTATPNASPLSSLSATAEVYRSDIILQSVQVLGIDQNQSDETSQADLAKTVTLEVNHNQAQRLSVATQSGHLSLILRALGETAPAVTQPVTTAQLTQRQGRAVKNYPRAAAPKPRAKTGVKPAPALNNVAQITIIRGEDTKSVSVISETEKETPLSDKDLAGGETL